MAARISPQSDEITLPVVSSTDCPHVKQPFSGCYCRCLNNTTIPLVIYYCREFYTECPIYKFGHGHAVTGNE